MMLSVLSCEQDSPLSQRTPHRGDSAVQCMVTVSFLVSFSYVRHRSRRYSQPLPVLAADVPGFP